MLAARLWVLLCAQSVFLATATSVRQVRASKRAAVSGVARPPDDSQLVPDPEQNPSDVLFNQQLPTERARAVARREIKSAEESARHTLKKVRSVDIAGMVRNDVRTMINEFLPDLRFRHDILQINLAVVFFSTFCIAVYLHYGYQNDRREDLSRWGVPDEGLPVHDDVGRTASSACDLKPDLVIVFHHPSHEKQSERDTEVPWSTFHEVLVSEADIWRVIAVSSDRLEPATERGVQIYVRSAPRHSAREIDTKKCGELVRGHLKDGWVALEGEAGYVSVEGDAANWGSRRAALELVGAKPSMVFDAVRNLMKLAKEAGGNMTTLQHLRHAGSTFRSEALDGHSAYPRLPTKRDARAALLKDLYVALPSWGFGVSIFSSIDHDELYVCVSLDSPVALDAYLLRGSTPLQLKQDVVAKLGIIQPPDEFTSSPPLMRYDPRIVQNLHRAQILQANDPKELYKTHYGHDTQGSIATGAERFKILYKQICNHLDLDAAHHSGLISDWYPSHSRLWLSKFERTWGTFSLLKDWSFVQPVPLIHDYFGARVAFIFAWNGFYCKALLPLAILSIIVELGCAFLKQHFDASFVHRRSVLSFSITVIIWSRIAVNLWAREQQYFLKLWDMNADTSEEVIRPSFQGEKKPSIADLNLLEKQYPAGKATTRRLLSNLVTMAFCGLVAVWIVVWTNIFEGNLDHVASLSLAFMIFVFQQAYNFLVPRLTEWENHKFQSTYYDSFVWKQFMFRSVNSYSAFFYLAIKQRYTTAGCPKEGCLHALTKQLWMTMLILSVMRIGEVISASLLVRGKIWLEDFCLQRERQQQGRPLPRRSFAEFQSKFADARLQEQIENMLQLVLALGFVLLFGAVAPIIVPFCMAVFVIQLRASAFLMVNYTKRPLPRTQCGIGLWGDVINWVMNFSIVFSGFLLIAFGDIFRGTPVLTKLAGAMVYVVIMRFLWWLVDAAYPRHAPEVAVLKARRQRVRHVVLERASEITQCEPCKQEESQETYTGGIASRAAEVKDERWDDIPHFDNETKQSNI